MSKLDPRLNAYRPDVADARLAGQVVAERFVEGSRMQVIEPVIPVHKAPRFDAMQISQALLGETVRVFAEQEGWAFVQLETDGYVGYVSGNALSHMIMLPTHRVAVPSTPLYTAPDLKSQPVQFAYLNSAVTVKADDGKYSRLSDGRFVWSGHLKPIGEHAADFVAVAEQFIHVPYYWGGKSVQGLDCSGLVQLSLEAAGKPVLRDSDMQERSLGVVIDAADLGNLRRGDLVFWSGHVGIMTDARTLLHANGHHMLTVKEPIGEAVDRIARSYGHITSIKRLQ